MNYGFDRKNSRLQVGKWGFDTPATRRGRLVVGSLLVVGGIFGFLPVLGFWMVPLGLLILSQELPYVRRKRRQMAVWWERRRRAKEGGQSEDSGLGGVDTSNDGL